MWYSFDFIFITNCFVPVPLCSIPCTCTFNCYFSVHFCCIFSMQTVSANHGIDQQLTSCVLMLNQPQEVVFYEHRIKFDDN